MFFVIVVGVVGVRGMRSGSGNSALGEFGGYVLGLVVDESYTRAVFVFCALFVCLFV